MRRITAAAAVVLAALAAAAVTGAATATTAPTPALAGTVLSVDDFPGALQVLDKELTVSGLRLHVRTLAPVALGARSLSLASESMLLASAGEAGGQYSALTRAMKTKAGRDALAAAIASEFGPTLTKLLGKKTTLKVEKFTAGAPTAVAGGGIALPVTLKMSGVSVRMTMAYFTVDRVLGAVFLSGTTAPTKADVATVVGAARKRITTAFTVANTAAPTIAGTAQVGQTLTADGGTWSGGPSTFSYLWSRCAADGTACAAIPGATGATYAVAAGDVGSTLQVTVTGSNTVGARPASSAVTTPVA